MPIFFLKEQHPMFLCLRVWAAGFNFIGAFCSRAADFGHLGAKNDSLEADLTLKADLAPGLDPFCFWY